MTNQRRIGWGVSPLGTPRRRLRGVVVIPPVASSFILMEDSGYVLQEDGFKIELE